MVYTKTLPLPDSLKKETLRDTIEAVKRRINRAGYTVVKEIIDDDGDVELICERDDDPVQD